jgi:hypothetical protein
MSWTFNKNLDIVLGADVLILQIELRHYRQSILDVSRQEKATSYCFSISQMGIKEVFLCDETNTTLP